MNAVAEVPPADRRMRRARWLTLVWLATSVATSLVLPGVGLWRDERTWAVVAGAVGIAVFCAAQSGAMYAAVTPWLRPPVRRRWLLAFAAAAVLSVGLVGPLAAGRWPSWAWLGAGVIATAPLLVRVVPAIGIAIGCIAGSAAIASLGDLAVRDAVVVTATVGLSVAAVNWTPVWLWDLLVEAQLGRDARAQLAATEERLRFARDVHDLLGHNLTVIALKAELVGRLVAADPPTAQAEAGAIQRLASSALTDVREAVHGYRAIDLGDQITAVQQVLQSSGVQCTVEAPATPLPREAAVQLAPVLREATTNILRHSRATWCTITVVERRGGTQLSMTNDGVTGAGSDAFSSGLRGLSERLRESGGSMHVRSDGATFTLEATAGVVA